MIYLAIIRQKDKSFGITYAYEAIYHWNKEKKITVLLTSSIYTEADLEMMRSALEKVNEMKSEFSQRSLFGKIMKI